MGAFGQYAKINPVLIDFTEDEWKQLIEKKRSERDNHQSGEPFISLGQVAARFLGIPRDEDDYYLTLFTLSQNPHVYVWNDRLNKENDPEKFQALQEVLQINQSEQLSVNRFIAFLEGRQLIPSHEDPSIHRHIRESFNKTLSRFVEQHDSGFKHPDFRRVISDLIKWLWNHVDEILSKLDGEEVPVVLWYGDATKSELYFLSFILHLGLDLLIFHPLGSDIFKELDPERKQMIVQDFQVKKEPRSFPTQRPVRKATVAYQASKEIERILHTEETPIFKPWQYRSHYPVSITLKTTYDELFLMSRERAFIRPNFYIEGNEVHVPSLFAKVSGVTTNRSEYWGKIEELKGGELSLFIRYFPFTNSINGNYLYHYQHALLDNGVLDPKKMINSVWWKLKQLPLGVQEALAAGISRVCANPKLLLEHHETIADLKLYLFTQLTVLPESIVSLLLKFDYPQFVPRIILYNSGSGNGLARSDAALLLLLNELGFDIILLNPSGLRDIEQYMDEQYYDVHLMDQFEFNYEYKEPKIPIWRRFFKKDQ
ncbi:YceG family protein [Peribacillus sp. JNUCC 23]|uniref:YceG family protein n=1 Tax=Peribacillus sp. NPDC096379 TaxID=3364393 RepID=UPI0038029D51